jgi:hypothetical protein
MDKKLLVPKNKIDKALGLCYLRQKWKQILKCIRNKIIITVYFKKLKNFNFVFSFSGKNYIFSFLNFFI